MVTVGLMERDETHIGEVAEWSNVPDSKLGTHNRYLVIDITFTQWLSVLHIIAFVRSYCLQGVKART